MLNLNKSVTNNIAESSNAAIKKQITTKSSPKVICDKLKKIVKLQFLELQKSFYKHEGPFVIPENVYDRNSISERELQSVYLKFLTGELKYNPVVTFQIRKYTKKVLNLTDTFIINGLECQVCTNGLTCCCTNVNNLKLKRKPGTTSGCPKPTLSIDRKRKPEHFPFSEEMPNKITIIGN